MELEKELLDIKLQERTVKNVIADLEEQRLELNKKIHIFKVIEIANVLEEMVKDKVFKEYGINQIGIYHDCDYDIGNKINFRCYEKYSEEIEKYDDKGNYILPVSILKNLSRMFEGFHSDYINEDFAQNSIQYFDVYEPIKDKFMNLLISHKLRATLEHSQLKIDLPENQETSSRKRKI